MRHSKLRSWAGAKRRQTIKSCRGRDVYFDRRITAKWLLRQFDRQGGRCFYTGIPFVLGGPFRSMRGPSLDRLDPKKGYIPSNVVLCLTCINYMKNDYSVRDVLTLLEDIRTNRA